jgi:hypothetical protein
MIGTRVHFLGADPSDFDSIHHHGTDEVIPSYEQDRKSPLLPRVSHVHFKEYEIEYSESQLTNWGPLSQNRIPVDSVIIIKGKLASTLPADTALARTLINL